MHVFRLQYLFAVFYEKCFLCVYSFSVLVLYVASLIGLLVITLRGTR